MRTARNRQAGFSITEVLAAATILLVVVTMSLSGFIYTLKASHQSDIQDDLDVDVQIAMERIKKDLRLSSLSEMYYYPAGAQRYTAVSFPKAYDDDGDGAIETNAEGKISWDETLVYHVWPTAPQQLRLTTFRPRDNTLSASQCQEQLESVVAVGYGTNTYTGTNASTVVIFENLFNWYVTPQGATFNGYDSEVSREVDYVLGSTVLSNGAHTFKFTVIGKDSLSTNYFIGLDSLVVSPSYYKREAEMQRIVAVSGTVSVVTQYMSQGSWDGNYQLYFPATTTNWYITLSMTNDVLEEANFRQTGESHERTTVSWDTAQNPSNYVVMLEGDTTTSNNWTAARQTADAVGEAIGGSALQSCAIRVVMRGSEIANGGFLNYDGGRCRVLFKAGATGDPLDLQYAYIAKSASNTSQTPNIAYPSVNLLPAMAGVSIAGGTNYWTPYVVQTIEKTNNYCVTFLVSAVAPKGNGWQWRETADAGLVGSYVIPASASPTWADLVDANWASRAGLYSTNYVICVERLAAAYPTNGTYTSPVYDTHMQTPDYLSMSWNGVMPGAAGASASFKVRTAENEDMSDAAAWSAVSAITTPGDIDPGNRRYLQYQTIATPTADGLQTPKLNDVSIAWTGTTSLVDIGGTFTKGPGYGIFKLTVDGVDLSGALNVDLEIFKDTMGFLGTRRVTSSLSAEVQPRNTGK